MKPLQVMNIVIRPTLDYLSDVSGLPLNTDSAVVLLLATAAVESSMGEYIMQVPSGPARGIYQIEVRSLDDLMVGFVNSREKLKTALLSFVAKSPWPLSAQIPGNLYLATAVARLFYYRVKEPLPNALDKESIWGYYKKYWNSYLGATTREDFFSAWGRFDLSRLVQNENKLGHNKT